MAATQSPEGGGAVAWAGLLPCHSLGSHAYLLGRMQTDSPYILEGVDHSSYKTVYTQNYTYTLLGTETEEGKKRRELLLRLRRVIREEPWLIFPPVKCGHSVN